MINIFMDIFETTFFYTNRPPMNEEEIHWFRVDGSDSLKKNVVLKISGFDAFTCKL